MLCCAVLCCAVLCCAVLCCAVLCYAVLCCAVLCCAMLCCAVLCCAVLSSVGISLKYCLILFYTVLIGSVWMTKERFKQAEMQYRDCFEVCTKQFGER